MMRILYVNVSRHVPLCVHVNVYVYMHVHCTCLQMLQRRWMSIQSAFVCNLFCAGGRPSLQQPRTPKSQALQTLAAQQEAGANPGKCNAQAVARGLRFSEVGLRVWVYELGRGSCRRGGFGLRCLFVAALYA